MTLLARDLHRQRRRRRGSSTNVDERMQREQRAYARWAWFNTPELLGEEGHA
jgi:hypothetical protein